MSNSARDCNKIPNTLCIQMSYRFNVGFRNDNEFAMGLLRKLLVAKEFRVFW